MVTWKELDRSLICASASPRRKTILQQMGLSFSVEPADIDESSVAINPLDCGPGLSELAVQKARCIAERYPDAIVIGADTIVAIDGQILGKPRDSADATAMLSRLSGKTHRVQTGIALICRETGFCATAVETTTVSFRSLPAAEIDDYLKTGEPFDKAGSYAIQGRGMTFVERIDGCYYNVVGLPVAATIALFSEYLLTKEIRE